MSKVDEGASVLLFAGDEEGVNRARVILGDIVTDADSALL